MLGGSAVSLLYTLQGLDRSRYRLIVALIHPCRELTQHFEDQGIETIDWPGIQTFQHTALEWTALHRPLTWLSAVKTVIGWFESERRTLALVESLGPDLVHLNSAVLTPSAHALYRKRIPFVWHVREGAALGHFGLRHGFMQRAMLRWPSELIFLSEAERFEWVNNARGRVITNFVDFTRFNRSSDGTEIRNQFGIPQDTQLVLYLGGISAVKGIFPLLEALALTKEQEPRLLCLMPGSEHRESGRLASKLSRALLPAIGIGTHAQKVDQTIKRLGLENTCVRIGFIADVERFLAACDLLVFPATTNHFARPILEAGAMGKPVVASRFPIIEELVRDGETGLLVPPGRAASLADAMLALLRNPGRSIEMGARAHDVARVRYDAKINIHEIMKVYDELLADGRETYQPTPAMRDAWQR